MHGAQTEKELMRRYPGQLFGEFAMVSSDVRTASVRTVSSTKVRACTCASASESAAVEQVSMCLVPAGATNDEGCV